MSVAGWSRLRDRHPPCTKLPSSLTAAAPSSGPSLSRQRTGQRRRNTARVSPPHPAPRAKTQDHNAYHSTRHRQTPPHSKLIPLDEPLFLWYSSFWVQLQLIPVLVCAHLHLAKCAQFWCNISPLDATLPRPLVCVANKGLAQYLSPLDATLTKTTGWGVLWLTRFSKTGPRLTSC